MSRVPKKHANKFFNRTIFVIAILVLELGLIAGAIVWCLLRPGWGVAEIVVASILLALLVLQVIIFFRIVYKQTDAEFKIPWIVILLILPLFGVVFYLIFKPRGLRTKERQVINAQESMSSPFFNKKFDDNELGFAAKTINYLEESTKLIAFKGNKVTYYAHGEDFFPELVKCLKEAEEFIYLEFFIIKNETWWEKIHEVLVEKAKAGVDVRVMYDDMGCVGALPTRYDRILQSEGINGIIFNKFKPFLSNIFNNRDHRKIAVIDHKYGFTGGINLGDEYGNINSPFGYWKDTMIKIQGPAINGLIKIFYYNYSINSGKPDPTLQKVLDYEYETYDDQPGFVFPFAHGPGPFYKERTGEHTLINIIESAQKEVWISSPYFIPSEALLYSIRRAALAGVDVKLFLPAIPDKKVVYWMAETFFNSLITAGVKIYSYSPGFNHEKCVVADGKLAFIGTINMDYRSLVHHFECGAVLSDVPCIKEICDDFEDMKQRSVLIKHYKINLFKAILCSIVKIFEPLL